MVKLSSSNPEIFRNVGHSTGNLFQINHCLYPDMSRPTLVQNQKTPNESDGFRRRVAEPAHMIQMRQSIACWKA